MDGRGRACRLERPPNRSDEIGFAERFGQHPIRARRQDALVGRFVSAGGKKRWR